MFNDVLTYNIFFMRSFLFTRIIIVYQAKNKKKPEKMGKDRKWSTLVGARTDRVISRVSPLEPFSRRP